MAYMLWKNLLDDLTATASSEESAYPASNLLLQDLGKRWRSTDGAAQTLTFDYGSAINWTGAAFWGHNLASTAEVRFQLSNDSGFATSPLPLDEVLTLWTGLTAEGFPHSYAAGWFASVSARYARFSISDSASPQPSYMEAARVFAGEYLRVPVMLDSYARGWSSETTRRRTRGGRIVSHSRPIYRVMSAQATPFSEGNFETVDDAFRHIEDSKQIVWSTFPDEGGDKERNETMIGKFTDLQPPRHASYGRWVDLDFQEDV